MWFPFMDLLLTPEGKEQISPLQFWNEIVDGLIFIILFLLFLILF